MLIWTDPLSGCTVIGTHAPAGVQTASVPDHADPNAHRLDPATGMACAAPPRPSEAHVLDAATGTWRNTVSPKSKMAAHEAERTKLLRDSDWTQIPDSNLSDSLAWQEYRSKLRAMTFDTTAEPTWPTPPDTEGTPL